MIQKVLRCAWSQGYVYPWGNEWDPAKLRHWKNRGNETIAPGGAFPEGASGYGTFQQSGNVWEWCSDWYSADYYKKPEAVRNPSGPSSGSYRVGRGGSCWNDDPSYFRGSRRLWYDPSLRFDYLGFHLARGA